MSLLLPVCCAAVSPYVPQEADPVLEPWRWREMTELGGHGVRCVDEAPDGSLWFGGIGGLMRYDGMQVEWMPFDDGLKAAVGFTQPRDLLCSNLLCMPDGSLLAVIESVLLRWREGDWSVLRKGLGAAEYDTRLERAEDGTVWLHRPNALWHFSADLSQSDLVLSASKGERLSAFCLDGTGDAWILIDRSSKVVELVHIPLLDGRPLRQMQWGCYPVTDVTPSRETSICAGPNGKIWYVDSKGGQTMRSFDPQQREWAAVNYPESRSGQFFLFKDRDGTLWAAGTGSLLAVRPSGSSYYAADKLGLPNLPFSVFEAENGWWWVIVRGGHVYRLDPGFNQWRTLMDLHFECESDDGTQWFVDSEKNALSYHPSTGLWSRYLKSRIGIGPIRSLHITRHGLIWALGRRQGRAAFSVFDGTQWTRYSIPEFSALISEGALMEADDGTVWLGGGGDRLGDFPQAGGALRYEIKNGLPHLLKHYSGKAFPYAINRFAQTSDGTVWLGAPQLYSFIPDRNEDARLISDLPNAYTFDMAADAKGDLWVAKGLFGVFYYRNGEWRQYVEKGGLKGKIFVDLLPWPDGTVFAASDAGINRFDGRSWCAILPGDFGMSSRAGFMARSRDGSIWLNYGLDDIRSPRMTLNIEKDQRFCTIRYRFDTQAPDTYLEQLPAEVDSSGNLGVSWSGRDPWENTPADQLQYSWRINGGEWSPFSRLDNHTFLNLDSGHHLFEVRARDRDFNIDPTPARSAFSVAVPLWRRPWFILMLLVIIGGTVTFVGMMLYYREST